MSATKLTDRTTITKTRLKGVTRRFVNIDETCKNTNNYNEFKVTLEARLTGKYQQSFIQAIKKFQGKNTLNS